MKTATDALHDSILDIQRRFPQPDAIKKIGGGRRKYCSHCGSDITKHIY